MMISKIGAWEKILGFELFQMLKMDCGIFMFRTIKLKIDILIVLCHCIMTRDFEQNNSILQKNNENGCR